MFSDNFYSFDKSLLDAYDVPSTILDIHFILVSCHRFLNEEKTEQRKLALFYPRFPVRRILNQIS